MNPGSIVAGALALAAAQSVAQDSSAASMHPCCPVVELRQYTLKPGRRDVLIELFEREFLESQEAAGMRIIGQFREPDAPDRFVWLRGFAGMPSRAKALQAFYGGPVWQAHREAANGTMIDSGNVLLLKPARPDSGFADAGDPVPSPGADRDDRRLVVATVYYFDRPVDAGFVDLFERSIMPAATAAGASVLAAFVTESAENTFPRLPVREGEHVFVWFAGFADRAAFDAFIGASSWREASAALSTRLARPPEIHRLAPTSRSRLRG